MDDTGADQTSGARLAEEFDRAASRYDLLTGMNPGYHEALRAGAHQLMLRLPPETRPHTLWDLGCGSGLSTRALLDAAGPGVRIVGLDASDGMLEEARRKTWPDGVRFVHAPAQDLPTVAERELDEPADGAFAAYLLRNVPAHQRDEVVAAIVDQVRPGGWIALQDYHVKGSPLAAAVWSAVCWGVVTPLSAAVRGNPSIYRYLWRSVLENDSRAELHARLVRAGLSDIRWTTAGGWQRGILHTVVARRPA